MTMRKKIIRIVLLVVLAGLIYGAYYCWNAFPIISGYGAKNMASALFIQHRKYEDIKKEDLGSFPLSLAKFKVDYEKQTVTASVFGFAKKKAIYKAGAGCTLINDF